MTVRRGCRASYVLDWYGVVHVAPGENLLRLGHDLLSHIGLRVFINHRFLLGSLLNHGLGVAAVWFFSRSLDVLGFLASLEEHDRGGRSFITLKLCRDQLNQQEGDPEEEQNAKVTAKRVQRQYQK